MSLKRRPWTQAAYRGPAFTGNLTFMTVDVVDKVVDEEARNVAQVDCSMSNQPGTIMATARAEVELPGKG